MRAFFALSLLALPGCSTYVLRTSPDDTHEIEDNYADTAVWGETCPDLVHDAWEVTGSPGCAQETDTGTLLLPDLTLAPAARCEVDCDEDRVVVWVHPGNRGKTDLSGAHLIVYKLEDGEREELEIIELDGTLRQLWFEESVQVDLQGHDLEDADALIFRLESDQPDCDETNDEHNELGPFCE